MRQKLINFKFNIANEIPLEAVGDYKGLKKVLQSFFTLSADQVAPQGTIDFNCQVVDKS